jgi:hypothetical protein
MEWTIYGIGVIIAIIAVIYITHLARRALDKYISREELP